MRDDPLELMERCPRPTRRRRRRLPLPNRRRHSIPRALSPDRDAAVGAATPSSETERAPVGDKALGRQGPDRPQGRLPQRLSADGFQVAQIPVSALGRPQERFGHSFACFVIAAVGKLRQTVSSATSKLGGGSPVKFRRETRPQKSNETGCIALRGAGVLSTLHWRDPPCSRCCRRRPQLLPDKRSRPAGLRHAGQVFLQVEPPAHSRRRAIVNQATMTMLKNSRATLETKTGFL